MYLLDEATESLGSAPSAKGLGQQKSKVGWQAVSLEGDSVCFGSSRGKAVAVAPASAVAKPSPSFGPSGWVWEGGSKKDLRGFGGFVKNQGKAC